MRRVEAETGATRERNPNVSVDVVVAAADFKDDIADTLDSDVTELEAQCARRENQPVQVRVQSKDAPIVDADPFKYAIAIQVAVVEKRQ